MADLRKQIGDVVGSYKGTSVKMVSKLDFESKRMTGGEYIYAVVDGSTQIPLVKSGKIIGIMNPQGDVDECRAKAYKFPEIKSTYKSPARQETVPSSVESLTGSLDLDKFIQDSLSIDLLAGWAKRMGVEETTEKQEYNFK